MSWSLGWLHGTLYTNEGPEQNENYHTFLTSTCCRSDYYFSIKDVVHQFALSEFHHHKRPGTKNKYCSSKAIHKSRVTCEWESGN
jgi:hypothetical protein